MSPVQPACTPNSDFGKNLSILEAFQLVQAGYAQIIPAERALWQSDPIYASRVFAEQARGWQANTLQWIEEFTQEHEHVDCSPDCGAFMEVYKAEVEELTPWINRLDDTKNGPVEGISRLLDYQEARSRLGMLLDKRARELSEAQ